MLKTQYFLFKVRIHPISGDDTVTCVNPNGEAFEKDALETAAQQLYAEEAAQAGPDEGVLIQTIKKRFTGIVSDDIEALSYQELAERFKLKENAQ
ncbi:MAG: hypothetical protein AAFY42_02860 [Pseudomonadota bacterium]